MPGIIRRVRRVRTATSGNLSVYALVGLEFAAIVCAVVVGLMVNQWRESRAMARTVDAAMTSLAQEMAFNHRRIEESHRYYGDFIEVARRLLEEQRALPEEQRRSVWAHEVEGWRGALPPMLRSSTFEMMLSTGTLAHLPFEEADRIAYIYTLQSMTRDIDTAWMDMVARDREFARLETVAHLFSIYYEVLPSAIGIYQALGRPLLAEHGYDLDIRDERLRRLSEEQMAGWQYADPDA